MFHFGLSIFFVIAWGCVGIFNIISKVKDMKAAETEKSRRQNKFDLINYTIVYLMLILLLVENAVDAAAVL